MLPLWLLKCAAAVLITASSGVGVWLPLTSLASVHTEGGVHVLAFANCLAASMLTTMAMVHLLPEALVTHGAAGLVWSDAGDDAHTPTRCDVAQHALVMRTLSWTLVGVLVPAMLDHVVASRGGGGSHGHAHGVSSAHEHRRPHGRPGSTSGVASSYNNDNDNNSKRSGGDDDDDRRQPALHADESAHDDGAAASTTTTTTTFVLLLLMCFHNVLEGLILGVERSAASLLSTLLPLLAHKFFDGVVVGVSLAKQRRRLTGDAVGTTSTSSRACRQRRYAGRTDGDGVDSEATPLLPQSPLPPPPQQEQQQPPVHTAATTTADAHASSTTSSMLGSPDRAADGGGLWSWWIVAWLLLTPLTLLLTARLYHTAPATTTTTTTTADAEGGTADGARVHRSGVLTGVWYGTPMLSAVNAAAAGSFLYVGLSLLMQEDAKSARNVAAMLLGTLTTYGLTLAEQHTSH